MKMSEKPLYLTLGFVRTKKAEPGTSEPGGSPFRDAVRVQDSFTGRIERKALVWLAARLPTGVNSDHLTLLGFAAMFVAGAGYAMARWNPHGLLLATACLAI